MLEAIRFHHFDAMTYAYVIALLSKFIAEFNLDGILIFEFQRPPFSNNLFIDYYIRANLSVDTPPCPHDTEI